MTATMRIIVNGFEETAPADATVQELIDFFREGRTHLIVELNRRFVHPKKRGEIMVAPGDRIEFIDPMFGG